MWVKTDDKLPGHPKIVAASKRLGRYGRMRALGTYVEVLCHCAAYLTDGFFSLDSIDELHDPEPTQALGALCAVGLLHPEEGGYRVHDFEDHNPSAVAEKQRRANDAARKRDERLRKKENPQLALAPSPAVLRDEPRTSVGRPNGRGSDVQMDGADSSSRARKARATRDPVPSRPVPGQDQNQRPPAAHHVLVKLAHTVLDERDAGAVPELDVPEELKRRAAKASIPYNGEALGKARDAADAQRRRVGR